jgi:hypothetical protein
MCNNVAPESCQAGDFFGGTEDHLKTTTDPRKRGQRQLLNVPNRPQFIVRIYKDKLSEPENIVVHIFQGYYVGPASGTSEVR